MGLFSTLLKRSSAAAPMTVEELVEACSRALVLREEAVAWANEEYLPPEEYGRWIGERKDYHFALFDIVDRVTKAPAAPAARADLELALQALATEPQRAAEVARLRDDLLWGLDNYPGSKLGHWRDMIHPRLGR